MKKRLRKKQKKVAASGAGAGTPSLPVAPIVPAVAPKLPVPVDDRIWTLQMVADGVPGPFAVAPDGGIAIFDSEQDTRMYCAARHWAVAPAIISLREAVASRCVAHCVDHPFLDSLFGFLLLRCDADAIDDYDNDDDDPPPPHPLTQVFSRRLYAVAGAYER